MNVTWLYRQFLVCLGLLAVSCQAGDSSEPKHQSVTAPIINGNLDTTHDAVVAVLLGIGACSGTIIHRDGANAWVLTAAHCVTPSAPQSVAQGDDYSSPTVTYPVADYAYHPAYSGQGGLYDIAVVRITGATAATPVIPAMTPAEDNLAVGTQVRHVGYGITWYPSGYTSERHETINTINSLAVSYFDYLQPNSGPCTGDSGGAALTVAGAERVVGVIFGGEESCTQYGLSGRVSAVYDSFILPFINGTPITMTCDECFTGATSGAGACAGHVNSCFADAECDAYVSCINACLTQGCVVDCASAHLSGFELYRNIHECVCTTGCPSVCAGDDMCTRELGEPCGAGSDCGSDVCIDGVCCDAACDGQCEACDSAGSLGSCVAIEGAPHGARPACVDDGSVCGGECNGSLRSGCTYPGEDSPCRALGCEAGMATLVTACDGAGTCPPSETISCAPYLCNGDICATSCISGTDCVAGHECDGGSCVGTDCTVDTDCPAPLICRSNRCETPPSVSPGGCSCTSTGGDPAAPLVFFVLGLVWMLVRRRYQCG